MSDQENPGLGLPHDETAPTHDADVRSQRAQTHSPSHDAPQEPATERSRMLAVVPGKPQPEARPISPKWNFAPSRFAVAAAAALTVLFASAGMLLGEYRQQAHFLAEHDRETVSLAETLKTLKVRLDSIESARIRDDLVDLRRSIGEMKASVVSGREFNAALAQLSQRMDHTESAQAAELSARLDKLEKKLVAPVAAAAPPAPPLPPAKQPSNPPRIGASVSMETTGSIARSRPLLRGYIVLDARDDVALVGGRYGEREVRLGDFLPGAGRVERIERQGGSWIVLTNLGLIASAEPAPD